MKYVKRLTLCFLLVLMGMCVNTNKVLAANEFASAKCVYYSPGEGDLKDYPLHFTVEYTQEGKIKFSPSNEVELNRRVDKLTCRFDDPRLADFGSDCYKDDPISITVQYMDMSASDFLDGHNFKAGCPGEGGLSYYFKDKKMYVGWTQEGLIKSLKNAGIPLDEEEVGKINNSKIKQNASGSKIDFTAKKIKIYNPKTKKTEIFNLYETDEEKLHSCIYSDGNYTLTTKINGKGELKEASVSVGNGTLSIRGPQDIIGNTDFGGTACKKKLYVQGCISDKSSTCSKVTDAGDSFIKISTGDLGFWSSKFELDKKATKEQQRKDKNQAVDFDPDTVGCEKMLTDDILDLLKQYYGFIIAAVFVALIGFGIFDFTKALTSSDEGEMKKAYSRFTKRVIVAVIIIVLPAILSIVLKAIGSDYGDECLNGFGQYTTTE